MIVSGPRIVTPEELKEWGIELKHDVSKVMKDVSDPNMTGEEFVRYLERNVFNNYWKENYDWGYSWVMKDDVSAITSWLRLGAWLEWRFAATLGEALAKYAEYIDPEFYSLFAKQIAEEAWHWHIRHKALVHYGGNMDGFDPNVIPEFIDLFVGILDVAKQDLNNFQIRLVAGANTVEWFSEPHHQGVVDACNKLGKYTVLRDVFEEIKEDERFHYSIAAKTWAKHCDTPEKRRIVADIALNWTIPLFLLARKKRHAMSIRHEI